MVQQNETDGEISTFDTALLAVTDSGWMADVTFLAEGNISSQALRYKTCGLWLSW
jgi:hypothetical protein